MELFLKIVVAAVLVLLLFRLWPAYKQWQESGRKAEPGDWQAALLPLGGGGAGGDPVDRGGAGLGDCRSLMRRPFRWHDRVPFALLGQSVPDRDEHAARRPVEQSDPETLYTALQLLVNAAVQRRHLVLRCGSMNPDDARRPG